MPGSPVVDRSGHGDPALHGVGVEVAAHAVVGHGAEVVAVLE